jgi:hypothetical protein
MHFSIETNKKQNQKPERTIQKTKKHSINKTFQPIITKKITSYFFDKSETNRFLSDFSLENSSPKPIIPPEPPEPILLIPFLHRGSRARHKTDSFFHPWIACLATGQGW